MPNTSPFKSMKDIVDAIPKDPASVKFGGGQSEFAEFEFTSLRSIMHLSGML